MARYLASFPEDAGVPEIAQALISKGSVAINTLVPGACGGDDTPWTHGLWRP